MQGVTWGLLLRGFLNLFFVEIIRGWGRRNNTIGVLYKPPGVDLEGFNPHPHGL